MEIKHYIKLLVPNKIDSSKIKTFFNAVSDVAKDIIEQHDDGKYITLTKHNNEYSYCLYLTQDLNQEQIDSIKTSLSMFNNAKLSISQDKSKVEEESEVLICDENFWDQICVDIAKHNHNVWLNNKVKNGWHYGLHLDIDNKVHPLMMPWERLPDQYKEIDTNFPSFFNMLLDANGYKIVNK